MSIIFIYVFVALAGLMLFLTALLLGRNHTSGDLKLVAPDVLQDDSSLHDVSRSESEVKLEMYARFMKSAYIGFCNRVCDAGLYPLFPNGPLNNEICYDKEVVYQSPIKDGPQIFFGHRCRQYVITFGSIVATLPELEFETFVRNDINDGDNADAAWTSIKHPLTVYDAAQVNEMLVCKETAGLQGFVLNWRKAEMKKKTDYSLVLCPSIRLQGPQYNSIKEAIKKAILQVIDICSLRFINVHTLESDKIGADVYLEVNAGVKMSDGGDLMKMQVSEMFLHAIRKTPLYPSSTQIYYDIKTHIEALTQVPSLRRLALLQAAKVTNPQAREGCLAKLVSRIPDRVFWDNDAYKGYGSERVIEKTYTSKRFDWAADDLLSSCDKFVASAMQLG